MKLGRWGRMPVRMGGGRCRAEAAYIALRDGGGTAYSSDDSALVNLEKRVMARVLARAASFQARGALQIFPEKATDGLQDWEKRFGVTPSPGEQPHQRRATIVAIRKGNGFPSRVNIIAAISTAIGETPTLLTDVAPINNMSPPTPGGAPTLVQVTGGGLSAGVHSVAYAFVDSSGNVGALSPIATITIAVAGSSIIVEPIALPTGAVSVRYYLSLYAGSSALQFVGQGNGTAIDLSAYPSDPVRAGLHHHSVIISAAAFADPVKVRKIHRVLGPMLSAWTGYSIAASSPFILGTDTTAGASPLTSGGF